jgi:predicted GIY-YIG superfamily endonuclease
MKRFTFYDNWNTPNTYDSSYRPFPESSGVYLLVVREFQIEKNRVKKTIFYVGSSNNISKRCTNHPVKKKILKEYSSKYPFDVACYFSVCNNFKEEEKRLIKLTQARCNKQWR